MRLLTTFRMDLHQIPELGFEEFKTQAYLLNVIKDFDCTIHQVQTGLILHFDHQKERTIAFRADMDALPIQEATGLPFASTHEGRMHACGHDGHMSILLGLAHWLNDHYTTLNQNVVLIFQPSEEKEAGANVIVDSGILQHLQVEAIFGLHLWPGKEKSSIWTRANELMATASEIDLHITGRAAHVADSELGIDACHVASKLLVDAYEMEAALPKDVFRLLKFGEMHAGTVRNVISDDAKLYGTLRSYDPIIHQQLKQGLLQIAADHDATFGTTTSMRFLDGYDAVINDPHLVNLVKTSIPTIRELKKPVLQAEDFGVYRKVCPILFFFLGIGDTAPLHNEKFDFDMDVLEDGLALFIDILKAY
ncbi:MAG: M20 family metallopeptidase [Defluviitaleaceae bacterium]|nr:M20 family metallopeptidase [Defluviitaleaceae bacterium]